MWSLRSLFEFNCEFRSRVLCSCVVVADGRVSVGPRRKPACAGKTLKNPLPGLLRPGSGAASPNARNRSDDHASVIVYKRMCSCGTSTTPDTRRRFKCVVNLERLGMGSA